MGGGFYSSTDRAIRATACNYTSTTAHNVHETFKAREVNNAMSPKGVTVRECRDSKDHPMTLAIMLCMDVTGSMGSIPARLVNDGLPTIMAGLLGAGVADAQIMFCAIGDHVHDGAPLQIGQFEASDELLDHWLTSTYLEGGGGGNDGESYLLAWYFGAKHTAIDCWEKRKQKGFLFTIGDEPVLKSIPKEALAEIMGTTAQAQAYTALELLDAAREKYHVYHIHVREGSNGRRPDVVDGWKQLMGPDNLLIAEKNEDVPRLITETIKALGPIASSDGLVKEPTKADGIPDILPVDK